MLAFVRVIGSARGNHILQLRRILHQIIAHSHVRLHPLFLLDASKIEHPLLHRISLHAKSGFGETFRSVRHEVGAHIERGRSHSGPVHRFVQNAQAHTLLNLLPAVAFAYR